MLLMSTTSTHSKSKPLLPKRVEIIKSLLIFPKPSSSTVEDISTTSSSGSLLPQLPTEEVLPHNQTLLLDKLLPVLLDLLRTSKPSSMPTLLPSKDPDGDGWHTTKIQEPLSSEPLPTRTDLLTKEPISFLFSLLIFGSMPTIW